MLLHLEFKLTFSTIFVGSFDIRASREFFPNEVRSPEIRERLMRYYMMFDRCDAMDMHWKDNLELILLVGPFW